jgi:hypothetical protein
MCKCRVCDCWYWNCCKTFVGAGMWCCCIAHNYCNPLSNMMTESCRCCCLSWFCCRCTGCGHTNLGISSICCAPVEFDDPYAEAQLVDLSHRLRVQSVGGGVTPLGPIGTGQRLYQYWSSPKAICYCYLALIFLLHHLQSSAQFKCGYV